MKRFYNDFYQSFGRTVHDLQEQQVRDIVEYAENGLSENEIVLLTDMDRRRVRDIIGHIKPIQEEILMEKPLFRVVLKFANSADYKKAQKYIKTANIKGMKVDYNYRSTNLLIVFDNIDSAFKDKRQFLDWIKKGKFKFTNMGFVQIKTGIITFLLWTRVFLVFTQPVPRLWAQERLIWN